MRAQASVGDSEELKRKGIGLSLYSSDELGVEARAPLPGTHRRRAIAAIAFSSYMHAFQQLADSVLLAFLSPVRACRRAKPRSRVARAGGCVGLAQALALGATNKFIVYDPASRRVAGRRSGYTTGALLHWTWHSGGGAARDDEADAAPCGRSVHVQHAGKRLARLKWRPCESGVLWWCVPVLAARV